MILLPALALAQLMGHSGPTVSLRGLELPARYKSVLFVFCSCRECHSVARAWAEFQTGAESKAKTLIAYAGEEGEAAAFARATGLSKAALLADPDLRVARLYRAMPCPAAFVFDSAGTIRYASKEVAGELEASPKVLIGQAIMALQGKVFKAAAGEGIASSQRPDVTLTGVGAGASVVSQGDIRCEIEAPAESSVTREFQFVNRSRQKIELDQALASCGCQQVTLLFAGKVVKRATLPPGKRIDVRVTVAAPPRGASKTFSVWLYSRKVEPVGAIRLTVAGN